MDRQDLVGRAKLAEHTEQYDVMVDCMKTVVTNFGSDFTQEERTLLSVAYKQAVGERRNSYRVLNSYVDKERNRNSDKVSLCESYKQRVYNELVNLCKEVIGLVESHLYKESDDNDTRVFYLKMKGDYYRYAAEAGDQESVEKGREAYTQANELAQELDPANPNKLGLALNFSVFYYEILKEQDNACQLAQTTFDQALPVLDNLKEQQYKEATNILGLMRDNLTIWNGNPGDDD